ncbi:MAG: Lrp/AsnC family transcriptional regulator, partial [Acidimicrobiales bacterium]
MPGTKPQSQNSKNAERSNLELLSAPNALDDIDRQIIGVLQRDGRRPYGAIAEVVGLSEAG